MNSSEPIIMKLSERFKNLRIGRKFYAIVINDKRLGLALDSSHSTREKAQCALAKKYCRYINYEEIMKPVEIEKFDHKKILVVSKIRSSIKGPDKWWREYHLKEYDLII